MEGCRQLVGGGNSHILMTEEVKRLGQDERQKILLNAGLKLEIPSEMGLAMKADLADGLAHQESNLLVRPSSEWWQIPSLGTM